MHFPTGSGLAFLFARSRALKNRFISARSYDVGDPFAATSFNRRSRARSDRDRPAGRPVARLRELNWRLNNFPFLAGIYINYPN